MSQMEIAYNLSKSIMEKVKSNQLQTFDAVWNAIKPRGDAATVKEKVLGLVGPELVDTLVLPIIVAIAGRAIAEALVHVARSKIMSPKMKIEISDKVIKIAHDGYAINLKKASEVVKSVLEIIEKHPDIVDRAFQTKS